MSDVLPTPAATQRPPRRVRRTRPRGVGRPGPAATAATYVWLGLAAVVLLFPVLLTVVGAFLPEGRLVRQPPGLLGGHYTVANYVAAWHETVVPLVPAFVNSLFVGVVLMVAQVVTSCLAAYALVFVRTPLRQPIFWLAMATIMVPYEAIVVPNALFVRSLGLENSRWSLVLPFLANGFGIFLMRQALRQFPAELRQAALIDGCGHLRFLFTIVLPAIRPSLTARGPAPSMRPTPTRTNPRISPARPAPISRPASGDRVAAVGVVDAAGAVVAPRTAPMKDWPARSVTSSCRRSPSKRARRLPISTATALRRAHLRSTTNRS